MAVDNQIGGPLPLTIGGGAVPPVPASDVDVMIENVPFWLAITRDTPYQRETAQYQRDQVDQQPEAGEQTLTQWWMRSQLTWHMGAGLDYLDTSARPEEVDRQRFKTCRNVNVWTPGKVSRLNASTVMRSAPAGRLWLEATQVGQTSYLAVARPSAVEVWNGATWTTLAVADLRAFCCDGANLYWATPTAVVKASVTNLAGASTIYTLSGADVPLALGWAKQRLMAGVGPAVYELSAPGPALPAPRYTHPVATWGWSSFCDGPSGILGSGYAGLQSGLFKFDLVTANDVPVLGPGTALLSMPAGEIIQTTLYYLGSMLIVGTNRGVRVCPFASYYGTVSLGPLTVDTMSVTALGGFDRYVYAGTVIAGEACLVRIDLSAPLDQAGHYAWAPDLVPPTPVAASPTAINFQADGRKLWAVPGVGVYAESTAPDPGADAWLQTARIRMGTVEDKHWGYGTVRGVLSPAAPITVERQLAGGDWTQVFLAQSSAGRFGLRGVPSEWIALRFHLAVGAELASYQLQALPAGARQRLVSFPVRVFDYEKTRSGLTVGYDGWALERLAILERLEGGGAEVTVTAPGLSLDSTRGVIEKVSFTQNHDPGDRGSGTGGLLQVVLRTTS